MRYLFFATLFAALLSTPVHAQCINPAGETGDQVFNITHNVMQYCDGDKWIGMGGGADTLSDLSCAAGQGVQYDGAAWHCADGADDKVSRTGDTMSGPLSVPVPSAGDHAATKSYVDNAVTASWPSCTTGQLAVKTAGGWGCADMPEAGAAAACTLDGVTKNDGESHVFYTAASHADCATIAQSRQCNDGLFGGSASYNRAACTSDDGTPNAFSFTDQTGVAVSTQVTSNTVTISGINVSAGVSVSGQGSPQVSINGGAWVTSGTITNGQSLRVRLTSASSGSTTHAATVTVGGLSDNWTVATASRISCSAAGGTTVTMGGVTGCKIPGASCPSGWTDNGWGQYSSKSCNGLNNCNANSNCSTGPCTPTSCTASSKAWGSGSHPSCTMRGCACNCSQISQTCSATQTYVGCI